MSITNISYLIAFGAATLSIIYGGILIWQILKAPAGNKKMQEIALAIQQGATAYLIAYRRKHETHA